MTTPDPILTTDPFDALCTVLQTNLMQLVPTLKNAIHGWPDPKWFEDTGANFPGIFFVNVSEKTTNMTSRNLVYKWVTQQDGTQNVYYERQRITYLLQMTLLTEDPQQRLDIGWAIKQYLINTIQLPINTIDTARFIFKDDRMPPGRDKLYRRDLTFEVSARVFAGINTRTNRTIQSGIGVDDLPLNSIVETTYDITQGG